MEKIHRLRDFSDEVNHWRSREEKNFSLGVQSIYPLSAWLENPPAWTNTHACRAEGVWHDCKQHCPWQQIILSLNQIPRGIFLSVTCLDALVFTCLSDVLTDCFYFNPMVRMQDLCLIIKTGVENLVWELTGRAGYIYIHIYIYTPLLTLKKCCSDLFDKNVEWNFSKPLFISKFMTCSGSVEIKDRNLYPIIATFLPFAYLTYFLTFVKRNKVGVIHEEMMLSQWSLLVEGTVEEQVVSELFECLRKNLRHLFGKSRVLYTESLRNLVKLGLPILAGKIGSLLQY